MTRPPADDEVHARIRRGDIAAWEELFRTWHARLVAFATTLTDDAAAAEEVVQDVFGRLWRNRATIAIEHSLRAYLYTAVRNGAINLGARRRTERERRAPAAREEAARRGDASPPSPLESLEAAEIAEVVRRAIGALPPRRREVLLLRWHHGLTHAEIARVLGISVKAVENHITRGLRSLKDRLGGVDPR